ncbi:hypothetical protein [Streptomyces sp. CMB-StM0423]|uniref:hypothetical protein n=1 Tax=Streptomyces sp. CMB-StM0423 TaxID=2059884 RepID=UPI000C700F1F|nr:hypothetical protein [Streptomyces sp. CMB-StM0423]AUH44432.1 hypothetical protein CXR04_33315 [Streptomyces sp. CMB-StM0423]
MSLRARPTAARNLTVAALLVAAAGFAVQMAAGVTDTPTIPPGLVAILAAAALVAFLPGRGAPVAGPVAGIFNLVALFVVSAADRLYEPSPASAFVGAWFMVVALIVATAAGSVATVRNYRPRPAPGR